VRRHRVPSFFDAAIVGFLLGEFTGSKVAFRFHFPDPAREAENATVALVHVRRRPGDCNTPPSAYQGMMIFMPSPLRSPNRTRPQSSARHPVTKA